MVGFLEELAGKVREICECIRRKVEVDGYSVACNEEECQYASICRVIVELVAEAYDAGYDSGEYYGYTMGYAEGKEKRR